VERLQQKLALALVCIIVIKIFAISGNQLMIGLMNALSEIYDGSVRFVLTTADSNVQSRFEKAHRDICQSFADKNRPLGLEAVNDHYDIIEKELIGKQ
jgi:DNA-binding FadR family transcriptional regulator